MDKKYTLQGLIGCILFGVGDWLLGAVDPARVNGDVFYFISAGHGAEYPPAKITATVITAVIGVLFMHQGCNPYFRTDEVRKGQGGGIKDICLPDFCLVHPALCSGTQCLCLFVYVQEMRQ